MKIVVDAMGGDFAPKVNVDGAIDALREYPDMDIILVGPQALVEETISAYGDAEALDKVRERLTVVDAPEVITTEEHPVMALRRKKNSTFVVGMDIVRRKEAQAFVSAGSTGALMAGAMFKIGRIKGIDRPALATLLPVPGRPMLLVDAGANTDCQPKWIVQFAMMGSAYMRRVMNVSDPEVGLLNIGVEAAKGNEQAQAAYALMEKPQPFHFIGNVEARDALAGKATVYMLPIPLSSGISLPDELYGKDIFADQKDAEQKIIGYMNGNVKSVALYDALMAHRTEYVYFRTDHHWTATGAYYAYEQFCKAKGITPTPLSSYTVDEYDGFLGTFYRDSNQNAEMAANPDKVVAYHPLSTEATLDYVDNNGQTLRGKIIYDESDAPASLKYGTFITGDNSYSVINNPDVTDGSSCVVVKESFGNAFVTFLTDHYQTIHVIDYR